MFSGNTSGSSVIVPVEELVSGTVYTVSTTYFSLVAPTYQFMNDSNAVGNANGNQWGSGGNSFEFITADLGSIRQVSKIIIGYDYTNTLPGGWGTTYTEGATVAVSLDNVGWTTAATAPAYASTGSTNGLVSINLNTAARYIRLSRPGYICVLEFQVWAWSSGGGSGGGSGATGVGHVAYTTPGTYTWVCPAGVTSVSVVCMGGGGGGFNNAGGGGGLGYKNNYAVTPGSSYTVVVGAGGVGSGTPTAGGDSYFVSTSVCRGGGGQSASGTRAGGTYTGDGGGNGGAGGAFSGAYGGGGGAGGYSGNGGMGGSSASVNGSTGSGGGGGGGGCGDGSTTQRSGDGGGVGLLGQGTSGAGGTGTTGSIGGGGGGGGSGGSAGQSNAYGGTAGLYGGGASGGAVNGGGGAVRIIWPGTTRQFPSTNTGDV